MGNSVLCIWVCFCFGIFVLFFRFCIWVITYSSWLSLASFFLLLLNMLIWLHQVLVAAYGIFAVSWGSFDARWHVGSQFSDHTVFHSGYTRLHSHNTRVPFSLQPRQQFICGLFDDSHSDRCEVMSHCGFDLHFSSNEWSSASFHVSVSHLYVFFGEMLV